MNGYMTHSSNVAFTFAVCERTLTPTTTHVTPVLLQLPTPIPTFPLLNVTPPT